MSDLQELLEAKRKDWAKPTDLTDPPTPEPQSFTPPVEPLPRSTRTSSSAETQAPVQESTPDSGARDGDRLTVLLDELDTLPPHNSKLTKFIMRLEPHLADELNQFCTGSKKLTPEMFVEAVLLILGGDEAIEEVLDIEPHQHLKPLLTEQRDDLRALITQIAQQRAERRSRAGVIRRTLSMAGMDVPK